MQVGPAATPTSPPRLDGLELYARPKADVVAEAAAATEAEADRIVEANAARAAVGLAAIALPGHLAVPSAEQTCCTYVLSQALLTCTSLQQCLKGKMSLPNESLLGEVVVPDRCCPPFSCHVFV